MSSCEATHFELRGWALESFESPGVRGYMHAFRCAKRNDTMECLSAKGLAGGRTDHPLENSRAR